jgi:putative oxidoreductase
MARLIALIIRMSEKLGVRHVGLLVARVSVGLLFMSTGLGKVKDIAKVTAFFTDLKIPAPGVNAVVASYTELIGGTLLVVGLGSRLAAIPLMVTMVIALLTAKADDIHGIFDLVDTLEWTLLVILLVVATVGPGGISLDTFVKRWWTKRTQGT